MYYLHISIQMFAKILRFNFVLLYSYKSYYISLNKLSLANIKGAFKKTSLF